MNRMKRRFQKKQSQRCLLDGMRCLFAAYEIYKSAYKYLYTEEYNTESLGWVNGSPAAAWARFYL